MRAPNPERETGEQEHYQSVGGAGMGALKLDEIVMPFGPGRYFFVLVEAEHHIRDVLGAPEPAAYLLVLVPDRLPEGRRHIGVHIDRIIKRHRLPIAIIVQKALPENA